MNIKKVVVYSSMLILPLALLVAYVIFHFATGPHWLANNSDPDYPYLLNSINLTSFDLVGHIHHPGTTLQCLGALALKILNTLTQSSTINLESDVLNNPEYYLQVFEILLLCLNASLLSILGILTYRLTKDLLAVFILQLTPFFNISLLKWALVKISPEPLLLTASLFVVILMVFISTRGIYDKPKTYLLFFSIVSGFGIATKLTFLPLIVLPILIFPYFIQKIGYIAGTLISFIVFTLPIMAQYKSLYYWICSIIGHAGRYGTGSKTFLNIYDFLSNLKLLCADQTLFLGIVMLSIVALIGIVMIPKLRAAAITDLNFKLLFVVVVAELSGITIVAKHYASHYLLPVISLSGLNIILIFWLFKKYVIRKNIHTRLLNCIIVFFIVLVLVSKTFDILRFSASLTTRKNDALSVYKKVQGKYRDYAKIYYYSASSPIYALQFGNKFAQYKFTSLLKKKYPNFYEYSQWQNKILFWNEEITLDELIEKYGDKIIFQGTLHKPDIELIEVYRREDEAIYILKNNLSSK